MAIDSVANIESLVPNNLCHVVTPTLVQVARAISTQLGQGQICWRRKQTRDCDDWRAGEEVREEKNIV